MDINDSNNKSQQTGGLKLMTVFIAVLALHVVVIGGFTVYHLMSGGSSDIDITTDKNHKSMDSTMPDASTGDKSTPPPPTEVATIPSTTVTPTSTPAPAGDATAPGIATPSPTPEPTSTAGTTSVATAAATPSSAPAIASEPTSAPAPTVAQTVAPSTTPSAAPEVVSTIANPGAQTPTGPIPPDLAPPPDAVHGTPAPAPMTSAAPSAALASGPVHMPPPDSDASRVHHAHEQIYIVKITDSYKKIAHAHHCTVAQLKEVNRIKGNMLHTGQKLFIPSQKSEVAESAPTATSTLSSAPAAPVANESAAPMTTGLTSTSTSVATTGGLHHHTYTVVKGDTLTKIAHRFKTTTSALMTENGITDPTKLSIGKKLRIPSRDSRSASNNAPAQVQAKSHANAPTAQLANYAQ